MAKFCETRFAQSDLMVYKNLKKNYNTYRTTWSGDAVGVEPELDAATAAAQTTVAQREDATESAATTTATTSITTVVEATSAASSTTTTEQMKHWLL